MLMKSCGGVSWLPELSAARGHSNVFLNLFIQLGDVTRKGSSKTFFKMASSCPGLAKQLSAAVHGRSRAAGKRTCCLGILADMEEEVPQSHVPLPREDMAEVTLLFPVFFLVPKGQRPKHRGIKLEGRFSLWGWTPPWLLLTLAGELGRGRTISCHCCLTERVLRGQPSTLPVKLVAS